ncbi:MAG: TetR/AcrR family transcriptional regulator [Gemmatimonadaceae bacterium]
MFAPRRSDAAERILREAMRLFAEKGYERTSIADIQAAAGLNPGSGALYKHFPSKEAVLRAGVERFVAETRQAEALMAALPGPADDVLLLLGRAALDMLAADRDMLRVMWRELEPFPDLRDHAREGRVQASYAAVAGWLRARAAGGELRVPDPEATAVALLGSLTMFRVFEALLGSKPGRVDDERLLRAWHDLVTRGLSVRVGETETEHGGDGGASESPSDSPGTQRGTVPDAP